MKDQVVKELDQKAKGAIDALRQGLLRIRTGRANLSILDNVRVDYYGSKSPLNQVATLTVVDPRMITIKPFEKSLLSDIEKALRSSSELGITPQNDGERIMLPIPPLTEERRRDFTKVAKKLGEEAKVAVRNARREANEKLKALEKDGKLPEDDAKKGEKDVQKATDDFVKLIDDTVAKKEKEIMEV